MRTIPQDLYTRLDALLEAGVLTWCVAIELGNGAAFYLTPHNQPVAYKGITWLPFPLRLGDFQDSGEGDLPSTSLSLSNIGRICMPYLEGDVWDQAHVRIELVYLPDPTLEVGLRFDHVTQGAVATHENVTLSLAQPNYFAISYPPRRFLRSELFPGIIRNRQ